MNVPEPSWWIIGPSGQRLMCFSSTDADKYKTANECAKLFCGSTWKELESHGCTLAPYNGETW